MGRVIIGLDKLKEEIEGTIIDPDELKEEVDRKDDNSVPEILITALFISFIIPLIVVGLPPNIAGLVAVVFLVIVFTILVYDLWRTTPKGELEEPTKVVLYDPDEDELFGSFKFDANMRDSIVNILENETYRVKFQKEKDKVIMQVFTTSYETTNDLYTYIADFGDKILEKDLDTKTYEKIKKQLPEYITETFNYIKQRVREDLIKAYGNNLKKVRIGIDYTGPLVGEVMVEGKYKDWVHMQIKAKLYKQYFREGVRTPEIKNIIYVDAEGRYSIVPIAKYIFEEKIKPIIEGQQEE